ncbi:MAG: hypothetical protein AB3N18_04575 [Allomuricauda sp.]
MSLAIDIRRKKLISFLHIYGHLDKKHLVQKAQEQKLYESNQGIEDIYDSLMKFKEYHGIRIVKPIEKAPEETGEVVPEQPKVVFIDGHIKISNRSSKLVEAIKSEMADLQQQLKLLENLLNIYEKKS